MHSIALRSSQLCTITNRTRTAQTISAETEIVRARRRYFYFSLNSLSIRNSVENKNADDENKKKHKIFPLLYVILPQLLLPFCWIQHILKDTRATATRQRDKSGRTQLLHVESQLHANEIKYVRHSTSTYDGTALVLYREKERESIFGYFEYSTKAIWFNFFPSFFHLIDIITCMLRGLQPRSNDGTLTTKWNRIQRRV